jgi:hypothetical protein
MHEGLGTVKRRSGYKNRNEPSNVLRPTSWSIKRGNFVISRPFVEENAAKIDWSHFEVVAFGTLIRNRRLDAQRRLAVSLKSNVSNGDLLRLAIIDRRLVIDVAE